MDKSCDNENVKISNIEITNECRNLFGIEYELPSVQLNPYYNYNTRSNIQHASSKSASCNK